jgi:hypothetical protein
MKWIGFITTPSTLTLTASVSRPDSLPEHLIDMAARRLLIFCVGVQKRLCRRLALDFRKQADEISSTTLAGKSQCFLFLKVFTNL